MFPGVHFSKWILRKNNHINYLKDICYIYYVLFYSIHFIYVHAVLYLHGKQDLVQVLINQEEPVMDYSDFILHPH